MKELFFVLCVMSCGHVAADVAKFVVASLTNESERTWEINAHNKSVWDGSPLEGVVK